MAATCQEGSRASVIHRLLDRLIVDRIEEPCYTQHRRTERREETWEFMSMRARLRPM